MVGLDLGLVQGLGFQLGWFESELGADCVCQCVRVSHTRIFAI